MVVPPPLSFVDVFCGAGGFTRGAVDAGWEHVLGVDCDPAACATYAANHGGRVHCGDLRKLADERLRELAGRASVDAVLGSPPCQSFSAIGPTARHEHESDALFEHVVRVADAFGARLVLLENVPAMATKAGGAHLRALTTRLRRSAFEAVEWRVLDASEHEVPQRRRRLIVAAARGGVRLAWPARTPDFDASLGGAVLHASECEVAEARARYGYDVRMGARKAEYYLARRAHPRTATFVHFLDPRATARTLRAGYMKSRGAEALLATTAADGAVRVPDGSEPRGALRVRMLTIDEVKRIQTFPDDYEFAGCAGAVYRQIGNAVPVRLAYHLCRTMGDAALLAARQVA